MKIKNKVRTKAKIWKRQFNCKQIQKTGGAFMIPEAKLCLIHFKK